MRSLLLLTVAGLSLGVLLSLSACSGSTEPSIPTPAPRPTAIVDDSVPTIDELREIGLTDQQAECFIATIDPDNTGRVATAELFMAALSECV